MAETLTISPANLKYIENGLQSLNENIRVVNGNVDVVNQHVDLVEGKLESLYTDFMLFLCKPSLKTSNCAHLDN
jgi:hypothetical protein